MSVLIVAVVLAWIAILLLGLAVGGLLAQVRTLEARLGQRSLGPPDVVVPRLSDTDPHATPSGAFSAVFVDSSCDVCRHAVPQLVAELDGGTLLIVTDEISAAWQPLPPGVRTLIDPQAAERSGVPALPWFAAVDASGSTIESFVLGNPHAIKRAAQITHEVSATDDPVADRPSANH